jgi:hypothetical protein
MFRLCRSLLQSHMGKRPLQLFRSHDRTLQSYKTLMDRLCSYQQPHISGTLQSSISSYLKNYAIIFKALAFILIRSCSSANIEVTCTELSNSKLYSTYKTLQLIMWHVKNSAVIYNYKLTCTGTVYILQLSTRSHVQSPAYNHKAHVKNYCFSFALCTAHIPEIIQFFTSGAMLKIHEFQAR